MLKLNNVQITQLFFDNYEIDEIAKLAGTTAKTIQTILHYELR